MTEPQSPLVLENAAVDADGRRILSVDALAVAPGAKILILGPSGSGKTTLLHVLAGLRRPARGTLTLDGRSFWDAPAAERTRWRAQRTGVVLQRMHVLPALSVFDNLALVHSGLKRPVDTAAIRAALAGAGLTERDTQKARTLSHGEKQRLCIARAVLHAPAFLFADEPTSALDDANTDRVARLLADSAQNVGGALVVATHDARIKPHFDTVIHIENGTVRA